MRADNISGASFQARPACSNTPLGELGSSPHISKVIGGAVSRILFTQPMRACAGFRRSFVYAINTRDSRAGRSVPYLILLRPGFSVRRRLLERPVGSYPTFSPLPSTLRAKCWAVCFLWHCPSARLQPRCPRFRGATCPVESGLSSSQLAPAGDHPLLRNQRAAAWVACSYSAIQYKMRPHSSQVTKPSPPLAR